VPQATITLKHIAAELAENHGLPKKLAEAGISDSVTMAPEHLKNGDSIRLADLGIIQVRARPVCGWGAILQPVARLSSQRARRSLPVRRRN
jgi:hypothetical protein